MSEIVNEVVKLLNMGIQIGLAYEGNKEDLINRMVGQWKDKYVTFF